MKILLEYPWFCALGLGLPFLAVVGRFKWRAARHSIWARLLLCFIFACAVTPIPFWTSNGHSGGPTYIIPAVILFVAGMSEWPGAFAFGLSLGGAIPICIVTVIVLGIWSVVIKLRSNRKFQPITNETRK